MRANTAEIESTTNGVVFFWRLYGKLFSPVLISILRRWANERSRRSRNFLIYCKIIQQLRI